MSEFKKLDRVPSSDVDIRILITPLIEATIEYNDIIMENTQEAIHVGMERTKTELRKQGFGKKANSNMMFYLDGSLKDAIADIDFEEFSQGVSDRMKQDTFIASQGTIDRISGDVMDNIRDSYEAGYGIDKAAVGLQDVFDDMEDWELKRVARTETNGAQNLGAEATMRQLGVVYDKWKSAGDARVRGNRPEDTADHRYLDGQISYVSGNFSNGLSRPGDRSGPIREWIQCRCVLLPYLIPEGYTAPSGTFFYESDLIPIAPEVKPEEKKPKGPEPKYYASDNREAEKYIKEKLGLKKANYGDIKTEYANEINNTLVEYRNKYPKLAYKELKYYDMGHPSRGGIMGSSSTYNTITNEVEATLHINSKFFEKYPLSLDLKKKIKSAYNTGYTTAQNINDLVIHECGHDLVYANSGCQSNMALMDFRSILQESKGFTDVMRLGEYARINLSEGLAEAFVSYNRGENLPIEILKQLRKYTGVK